MAQKSNRLILAGAAMLLVTHEARAAVVSNADFTMWQEFSVAPGVGGASWDDYLDNIKDAATTSGFVNTGNSSTPGYFSLSSGQVLFSQLTNSGPGGPPYRSFNSWNGRANPGAVYGAAFANEYGSALHTPLLLVTTGGPITVNSITRMEYDALDSPGGVPGSWGTWSAARVGVTSYGPNLVLGGGDDSYTTIGDPMSTVPVYAVIATGPGFPASISLQYDGSPWPDSIPDEDIFPTYSEQRGTYLNNLRVDYTVNYTKGGGPLSTPLAGDTIFIVPEPSTFGLAAVACLAAMMRRRSPKRES